MNLLNTYIGFKSLWMVLYVFDDATTWLICICFYNDIYIYMMIHALYDEISITSRCDLLVYIFIMII